MQSKAATVQEYFAEMPAERRKAVGVVRAAIRKALPKGYAEVMQYGMIAYVVPLKTYPAGYLSDKKTPLPFAGLASQKNHMSIYLMTEYGSQGTDAWFMKAYAATGKKLDMGKSCIRFKRPEDLALEVIAQAIARVPVSQYITIYEEGRKGKAR